jgi:putative transposase
MEEALIDMYLAGDSVRQVEDIAEALWIYAKIETWRNRRIEGEHPYATMPPVEPKGRKE